MNSVELLQVLLKTTLSSSAAMLLVLALRGPVRRWLGASAAYLLWLAVPVALGAVLLPAPQVVATPMLPAAMVGPVTQVLAAPAQAALGPVAWLLAWAAGALCMAAGLWVQQRRFLHGLGPVERRGDGLWQAQGAIGLPAAMGVLRPRIVLPADFERRYERFEQQLVVRHEQVHLRRGDILINALWAALRCLYWFNPLLPLAVRRCREDQEFSCDERVIAGSRGARRSYGNAMLKTGLALSPLPVGCHWHDHHPLKERIAMLKRPVPGKKQWATMLVVSALLSSGLGYAAWAAQPARSTEAAPLSLYGMVVTATLDGTRQTFELRQPLGQPFSFRMTSEKGVGWIGEFTLQPEGKLLRLSGSLKADGVLVSSPMLLMNAEVPAGIQVSTPDGRSVWALEMRASPVATARDAEVVVISKQQAPPSYPLDAMDQGISGKVVLEIEVAADGTATDVTVVQSRPQGVFDAASIAAARQWRFTPARRDGLAVAGKVRVPIWFDLDEEVTHTDDATEG